MRVGELKYTPIEIVGEGMVLNLKDPEYIINFDVGMEVHFEIYSKDTWLAKSNKSKITRIDREIGSICTNSLISVSSGINDICLHNTVYIRLTTN